MFLRPFFFLTLITTSFVSAGRADAATSAQQGCWDPAKEPAIVEALAPRAKEHENPAVIELIHDYIWSHREEIDPRLVYHRIVGEAFGETHAVNKQSGAYGIFQFYKGPANSKLSHRQIIESLYKQNPRVSPRLIQVRYYLERYLQDYRKAADAGAGCNRNKKFSQYTNQEKNAYLAWGACNALTFRKEAQLCTSSHFYKDKACAFSSKVIRGGSNLRLCERKLPGTRTNHAPAPTQHQPRRSAR